MIKKYLRKLKNLVNTPFKYGDCKNCNHAEIFHREELMNSNYPGITCYGYNGWQPKWEKRCRCGSFIAKGNLDYLLYKYEEIM